jgi:membrane protein YqaA with SNARE-associated domain
MGFAYTKYGSLALVVDAFAESSFFPVPPDIILIPLSLSRPKRAFYYAGLCTIFSVIGGIFGYLIGLFLMKAIGLPILRFYNLYDKYLIVAEYYKKYDAIAVGIAGFTPLPYKLFTIAAGACRINFPVFVVASILSRGARFFIVSSLLYFLGEPAKVFIERYFNLLALLFGILLVGGFIILRYLV